MWRSGAVFHRRQPAVGQARNSHSVARQPHQGLQRLRQREAGPRVPRGHSRVPESPAVTPDHRYDGDLVPAAALEARQPVIKQHYAGISENIAGLIENILALKAAVKEVFLSTTTTTANDTAFEMSRRAYVRRMLNVRRSVHLFQVFFIFLGFQNFYRSILCIARTMPSPDVRLFVRLSVTHVGCIETAKYKLRRYTNLIIIIVIIIIIWP